MNQRKPNRLINQKSIYLRQHAYNPVDWYPWCEEAFEEATKRDLPIFLSIGYSSCHWCHVMEKESFENEEIAKILNDNFVSIKVDREEFPDVDNFYMTFVQATTGSGGWPLNVFLLPDKTPFYGGTYFPPEPKFGKPSFKEVLFSILEFYQSKRDELSKYKNQVHEFFKRTLEPSRKFSEPEFENIKDAYQTIVNNYDWKNGGWGVGAKFPMFPLINFLFDYWFALKDEMAKKIVQHNLTKILMGGIYDHIEGGMHRYTVDNQWIIPHFEKMLYDNIQLIESISKYLIIEDNQFFKGKLYETFHFLNENLMDKSGGYLSAIDADSEGEEGKYYLWNFNEIRDAIKEKFDEELFFKYYQLNVVEREKFLVNISMKEIPDQNNSIIANEIELIKLHLKQIKSKRIPPDKDNKILTDLNSLLISAFIYAYRGSGNEIFLNSALSLYNFINRNLLKNDQLFHSFVDGEVFIEAFAQDYFALIQALIDLYEVTFDEKYLIRAYELIKIAIEQFYDRERKIIYQQNRNTSLPYRTIDSKDYSIPSANSLAINVLLKLGKIFEDQELIEIGKDIIKKNFDEMIQNPISGGKFFASLLQIVTPPREIILVEGDDNSTLEEIKNYFLKSFSPNQIILFKKKHSKLNFSYLEGKEAINKKLTIYYCENFACKKPANDLSQISLSN